MLVRVVRIRRRVVPPEELAGRSIMVERRFCISKRSLGTLDVMVSSAVPPDEREALITTVLRQIVRRAVRNDVDEAGPASRVNAVGV